MEITGRQKNRFLRDRKPQKIKNLNRKSPRAAIRHAIAAFYWLPDDLRYGLAFTGLLCLVQIVGSLFGAPAWQVGQPVQSSLALAAGLLGTAGLYRVARHLNRHPLRLRLAWSIFSASAASFALARAAALIQPALGDAGIATSRLLDGIFASLFLFGALVHPVSRTSRRGLAQLSDSLIVILTSGFITWLYFLLPALNASIQVGEPTNPLTWMMQIAVPIGDLLMLWGLILLWMRSYPPHFQPALRLLLAAGAVAILSNGFHMGLLASSSLYTPVLPGLLQTLAACLLLLAGLLLDLATRSQGEPLPAIQFFREPTILQALRLGAPVIWVGVVFILLQIIPFQPSFWRQLVFSIWMGCVVTLMIVRQLIELDKNKRLENKLKELIASLDERVAERTTDLVKANEDLRQEMADRAHIEQILREREEAMEFTAMHDALTGLPNRLLLMEHLRQAIRKIQRWDKYDVALLFLDFDGFKAVNDRLGHPFGDKVLIAVAQRLRHYVRQMDTVARLGGDEFVVLLQDVHVEAGATCPAVERLREVICAPYEIDGQRVILSASIGVVIGDRSYQQPADFLRDADLAMYEAKARGKDRYVLFGPKLRKDALERLVLEDDLRGALARDELVLYYHPILSLDTHRITGFEALVRWQHPQRGLLLPHTFLPIAETAHLILPITRHLLLEACTQMTKWQAGHPHDGDLTISLNLSPALFAQPGAMEIIEETLAKTGLSPRFLKLEITEGAIGQDNQATLDILHAWNQLGIQIQMDDFGTGYASLSYLHRYPVDTLKIDRSFIQGIQPNGEQGRLARTVITLARELNLEVIAEGVETVDQLAFLESLGCQYAQGYLISHPLPREEVTAFLRAYPAQAASWFETRLVIDSER